MEFCKAFNDKTTLAGKPVPVEITVYKDKKFDFEQITTSFIREVVKLKVVQEPGRNIIASLLKNVEEIVKHKMNDLNKKGFRSR